MGLNFWICTGFIQFCKLYAIYSVFQLKIKQMADMDYLA